VSVTAKSDPGVQAVILAGGLGSRLRRSPEDPPKALVTVDGTPFLGLLLGLLRRKGVRRFVVCTGFRAEEVERFCGDGSSWDAEVLFSREETPLGTGGALALAAPFLSASRLLVLNGDTLVGFDLAGLFRVHEAAGAVATLVAVRVADRARYGAVRLDDDGRVVEFSEKGCSGPGLVNGGVAALSPALVGSLGPPRPLSLERDVLATLVGCGLWGLPTEGPFLDIGTPDDLARAASVISELK
jgi:NDP-sugar pyrophosphorylase family protein